MINVIHASQGALLTDLVGTIAANGTMSGTWADVTSQLGYRTGIWASTSGAASKIYSGSQGWTGLFSASIPIFTFTTDANGAGSWHFNVKDADLPGVGPVYQLSVWINEAGATILISNQFSITKG
jgi:hypothetical protein